MFLEIPKDCYTLEEKMMVFLAVKEREGEIIAISVIAKDTHISAGKVKFIMILLLHWGYLEKVCLIDMGPHYKRYTFKILKDYIKDKYEDKAYQQGAKKYGIESMKVRNKLRGDKNGK